MIIMGVGIIAISALIFTHPYMLSRFCSITDVSGHPSNVGRIEMWMYGLSVLPTSNFSGF